MILEDEKGIVLSREGFPVFESEKYPAPLVWKSLAKR